MLASQTIRKFPGAVNESFRSFLVTSILSFNKRYRCMMIFGTFSFGVVRNIVMILFNFSFAFCFSDKNSGVINIRSDTVFNAKIFAVFFFAFLKSSNRVIISFFMFNASSWSLRSSN